MESPHARPSSGARFDALVRSLLLTVGRTGREALVAMIDQLGSVLNARRAHVAVPAPDRTGWFRTIAHWQAFDEPLSLLYPIEESASGEVWTRGEVAAWEDVGAVFPGQRDVFARWGVGGLFGLRLDDSEGRPLGVLMVTFGEDAFDRDFAATLIRIFALRAVGELSRLRSEAEHLAAERSRGEAEAALAAQAAQFGEVFEHTEDAVFFMRVDPGERFVFERVNQRFAAMARLTPADFAGRTPEDVLPAPAAERMHADNLECLRAGAPVTQEREFSLAAGTMAFRITLIPSRDSAGRVARIVGFASDITGLRRQRALLAESEAIARVGGWELDCATGQLLWTPGTYRIFERDPEAYSPTLETAVELYTEECRATVRIALERALRDGGEFEFVATARLDSGRIIHVRAIGEPTMVNGRPVRLFGGVQDITAQEEANEQRLRLEAQLRRAQKMEAVGALAGGIAHDFNNILAGIMGNAQLATLELAADAPARRFIDNAYQGCLRARDLIRRILTFSRQAEQPHVVASIQPIVEEALALLRASLPATILIRTRYPSEILQVLADPGQLHQVVLNLCTNAAQAMRAGGGELTIELASSRPSDAWHRLHPQVRPEHRVRLSVRDTGCGIAPEALERIFEPFYTTKPIGEGSGLGLAMVHGIVENHGGAIVVESQVGAGSGFHVFLPGQSRALSELMDGDAPLDNSVRGAGQTILVIDDEPALTTLAEPLLQHLGYRARIYNDPRLALDAFTLEPDAVSAVLCDLTMPGLDGIAFARTIHAVRPQLPVILMTGFLRPADIGLMRSAGIQHHLTKPFSMGTLANKLREVLPS